MSPVFNLISSVNIGPAYAKEWNSPFSPQGSMPAGKIVQQLLIERAAGERAIELARIDAGQPRLQAGVDHVVREIGVGLVFQIGNSGSRPEPARRSSRYRRTSSRNRSPKATCVKPSATKPAIAVSHDRFVLLVRARPRQRHDVQRQAGGCGLRFQQLAPDRVHRDAIEGLVGRREEPGGGIRILLVDHVQHPRGILAGGPRDENLHGCSAFAIFSMPSMTRGPGTVRPGPVRITTRLFLTAGTDDSVTTGRGRP